jgi:Ni,Fe-hydrogenase III small subunit
VEARPDLFAFEPSPEVAALDRAGLFVPERLENDEELARLRVQLQSRVKMLRRSVHVRHVDAGSDGSEEWEVAALLNPVYDVQRLGIFFTASPRHADLLLVTGTGTAAMVGPLRSTYEAMPDPKVVLAAGTDAASGGLVHPSYTTCEGIGSILPVDVFVPGSPPSPFSLLHGILLAIGLLPDRVVR